MSQNNGSVTLTNAQLEAIIAKRMSDMLGAGVVPNISKDTGMLTLRVPGMSRGIWMPREAAQALLAAWDTVVKPYIEKHVSEITSAYDEDRLARLAAEKAGK